MNRQNSLNLQIASVAGLFIVIHILSYNPFFSLKIINAVPVLTISAVVAVSYYFGSWWGFLSGVFAGIFADAATVGVYGYNAIFLLLVGLIAGILLERYLNSNILSACVLSFSASALYFLIHGVLFTFNYGVFQGLEYLLLHSLPSAVYSGLFIFPFFFLLKLIKKI